MALRQPQYSACYELVWEETQQYLQLKMEAIRVEAEKLAAREQPYLDELAAEIVIGEVEEELAPHCGYNLIVGIDAGGLYGFLGIDLLLLESEADPDRGVDLALTVVREDGVVIGDYSVVANSATTIPCDVQEVQNRVDMLDADDIAYFAVDSVVQILNPYFADLAAEQQADQ